MDENENLCKSETIISKVTVLTAFLDDPSSLIRVVDDSR